MTFSLLWHNSSCWARPACTASGLGLSDLLISHSRIVSSSNMGSQAVHLGLELMTGMLYSRASGPLYHETSHYDMIMTLALSFSQYLT